MRFREQNIRAPEANACTAGYGYRWYHILFRFIPFFLALFKLAWDVAFSFPFSLEGDKKGSFVIISPFL